MRPHDTAPPQPSPDGLLPGAPQGDFIGPFEVTLAAEVVTNSVRHADTAGGAVVTVRAEIRGDALRVEVEDGGSGGSVARRAPDLLHGGGCGLNLVNALSRRWGVVRDAGTRVWAELAIPAVACDSAGGSAVRTGSHGGVRQAAARAGPLRADNARRRAGAARRARESAATEPARGARDSVAYLHAARASHHHAARTLPRGGDHADAA